MLRQPRNSGSTFYNYKHQFSIVLMALADADYNFLYVDVGRQGRISDGAAANEHTPRQKWLMKSLSFLQPHVKTRGSVSNLNVILQSVVWRLD